MTNDEIKRIINDAKAATQYEWKPKSDAIYKCGTYGRYHSYGPIIQALGEDYGGHFSHADAARAVELDALHIANTCPAVIVPLLEELLRLREHWHDTIGYLE